MNGAHEEVSKEYQTGVRKSTNWSTNPALFCRSMSPDAHVHAATIELADGVDARITSALDAMPGCDVRIDTVDALHADEVALGTRLASS